jgi:dihydrofolate reductase
MGRELILKMSMSIDGFVCGPNGEMDWVFATSSEAGRQWVVELLQQAGVHAMGHRAYQQMSAFWPTSPLPFAKPMNETPKAVFSKSGEVTPPDALKDAAPSPAVESWLNPIVGGKDLVADIERLKAENGKPILAHGGAAFASSLISNNLVDTFHLVVHPVVLGRGLPIFTEVAAPFYMKLEDLRQYDTGTIGKTYRRKD